MADSTPRNPLDGNFCESAESHSWDGSIPSDDWVLPYSDVEDNIGNHPPPLSTTRFRMQRKDCAFSNPIINSHSGIHVQLNLASRNIIGDIEKPHDDPSHRDDMITQSLERFLVLIWDVLKRFGM
ncbi:hypothetical protein HHK36_033411 [Tetracentron sinense]|uniref:Uncharacterized protein n=1 Tax=Tetracentron sinense TaxID=13715 RepID=A0A834Y9D3_TETSI|nr:hypothetical protein HHK36_033411 [Tetracentron sinense]